MTDRDEQLPAELTRRNWVILALLILGSLAWQSQPVTLGVVAGGLVAVGGFYWLKLSLIRLLAIPEPQAPRRFQFSYLIRLVTLAMVLFALVAIVKVHPVALAVGLSVVVINLLWTAATRTLPSRRQ